MKPRKIFTGILLAIILALGNVSTVFALPPLPDSFFGTVKINGANVPAGTTVTAWCGGVQYASSYYLLYEGDTVYSLNVPGDDPATPTIIEGCVNPAAPAPPAMITFYVGGVQADETASWVSQSNNNLALTVSCYALTLGHTGQGNNPVASPSSSSVCSAGHYLAGETINLNGALPESGWQIHSWTGTDNDTSTSSTNSLNMPVGNRTVSVNYTAWPVHTVSFNANGGLGTMSNQSANLPTALALNSFTHPGYSFGSWNTQADGLGTSYADGEVYPFSADVTLYAQWNLLPVHTVGFNANGGLGTMSSQSANLPTALVLNSFTRPGYSFGSWNTQADGLGTSYADGEVYPFSADVTLYAQWLTILPGAFGKITPADAARGILTTQRLSWQISSGATSYEYCYAVSSDCTNWISAGVDTSVNLTGLKYKQVYYWQVRAVNAGGVTMADSAEYWSFTTCWGLWLPLVFH